MTAVRKVLIVGGGFSGMAAAIELRRLGIEVDLAEIDASWRSYGAGISLSGPTIRAFRRLGILEDFLDRGHAADGALIFTPDGQKIAELPTPRIAGPDVPGSGGIMRPVLAEIMAKATRAAGANVMLGTTYTRLAPEADGVGITFSDGRTARYDLVVGADGLYSKTRAAIFPDAPQPSYTGQCVWRAVVPRPKGVETAMMWLGHRVKAGLNPVSNTEAYLFVTEDRPNKDRLEQDQLFDILAKLIEPFTAPEIEAVKRTLTPESAIVYRPLEALLVPPPWHRGRVVLIGDAVHATTPHLASGAAIGIEDGMVLAEELGRAQSLEAGLQAFVARRWERCRIVVENSLRLGEIEIHGGDKAEHAGIMRQSTMALAEPF